MLGTDLGPLQEQAMFLTAETSPALQNKNLKDAVFILILKDKAGQLGDLAEDQWWFGGGRMGVSSVVCTKGVLVLHKALKSNSVEMTLLDIFIFQ